MADHRDVVKMSSKDTALAIIRILYKHKAEDIRLFYVEHMTSLTDYYVICNGRSTTQVRALCDQVEEELEKFGKLPLNIEGRASCTWLLADYGDVVVHIMGKETRDFYNLERLWNPENTVNIDDFIQSCDEEFKNI